jgi:NAD(P)-dependent dehydrogenase (short-subunit alcohol dehydrogenase family)
MVDCAMTTAVLITGTSTGIGRATALRLARRHDLTVYATARRLEAIDDLAVAGARTLAVDVTDEDSMRAAVDVIATEHGHVGVLVNNAGTGTYGTVEETDIASVREQLETNVLGPTRLIQLVLPGMRAAGNGRIVTLGSMGGRLVLPVWGYYHASKYAIEALTDALRYEVAPFGITVSLVEPGVIRTGFGDAALRVVDTPAATAGPYAHIYALMHRQMVATNGSALLSGSAEAVAKAVERAVTSRRPRTRYVVTPAASALVHTRRLLGGRAFDAFLRVQLRDAGTRRGSASR